MRTWIDGYALSAYVSQIGPLAVTFTEEQLDALSDAVSGALPGRAQISPGVLNGLFDNTATSGLHALMNGADAIRQVMVAIGDRVEPGQGVPAFCGAFRQAGYQGIGEGVVAATVPFSGWDATAATLGYPTAWGVLLHAAGAETAVNTAVGVDDSPQAAATTRGGFLAYQVHAGNGTATIKVQDAATNLDGSFADLTGATTGSINCATVQAGLVAIGNTATVRRYLRWQIVFGTATSVNFSLAFVRGTGA